jgi:sarcosine oxidase subunit beta
MRVVVIGGGVIGASAAYHLAARGVRDVVVLDRTSGPGQGSTGRATGGFRAQFGTDVNVRLSLLSRAALLRFADEVGGDPGYEPRGYLWLAGSGEELAALAAAREVQRAAGLADAVEVSPDEIRRLNPGIDAAGLAGGSFCPSDGFVRPLAVLDGYLAAAARRGARVEWGAEVVALERAGDGRLVAARTAGARVEADAFVLAAGAWAAPVAALAGVSLPVAPLRRQVLPTAPQEALPREMPMTIFSDGFHLRVRDGRALLLWPDPAPAGFDASVDPAWMDRVEAMARARVPALAAVPVDRAAAWAGLYEMTPDRHALVGAAPGCANLVLVCGSSGHGVMHAPALGRIAADLVCGADPPLDLAPLRPSRFAEGAPNPSGGL